MSDIYHEFGNDIEVSSDGDIMLTPSDTVEGQQRVIRRLLTNSYDYFFNVAYGAGLPAFVGQPGNINQISAVTRSNLYRESLVQQNPPPVVSVSGSPDGTFILDVQYVDSITGQTSVLTLPVGEN